MAGFYLLIIWVLENKCKLKEIFYVLNVFSYILENIINNNKWNVTFYYGQISEYSDKNVIWKAI